MSLIPEKRVGKPSCAMLMAKYPTPGTVKTRLAHHIGNKCALDLYILFVRDIIRTIAQENIDLRIAYTPRHQLQPFKKWLGNTYDYVPQIGNTLGERLISVFKAAFASRVTYAVALASDTPDLPGNIVSEALEKLVTFDSVIGPCPDGGYYLIGFRSDTFVDDVFHLDQWSTSNVFHNTVKSIQKNGLSYHVLPFWRDIDDIDDLMEVVQNNTAASALRSIEFAKQHLDLLRFASNSAHKT